MSSTLWLWLFDIRAESNRRCGVLQILFLSILFCFVFFTSIFCTNTSQELRPIRLLSDKPRLKKRHSLYFVHPKSNCSLAAGLARKVFALAMGKKENIHLFPPRLFILFCPLVTATLPSAHVPPPFSSHLLSCACSGGPVAGVGSVVALQRDVQHGLPAAAAALQLLGARLGRVQGSSPGEPRVQQPFLQR